MSSQFQVVYFKTLFFKSKPELAILFKLLKYYKLNSNCILSNFVQRLNKNDKLKKNSSTNDINKINENSYNNSSNGLEDFFKNLNLSKPLQVKILFSSQHI